MKPLYEKLQEKIVQQNTHTHKQSISEKLNPAFQIGLCKNHIFGQSKSQRKADAERHDKSSDVRGNNQGRKDEGFSLQDKIIADKIDQDIQNGIGAATGEIPEGLLINPPRERLMKEINDIENDFSYRKRHNAILKETKVGICF